MLRKHSSIWEYNDLRTIRRNYGKPVCQAGRSVHKKEESARFDPVFILVKFYCFNGTSYSLPKNIFKDLPIK